jgi:hypothetical protein
LSLPLDPAMRLPDRPPALPPGCRLVALDVLVKLDDLASGDLALEARTGRVVNRSQAVRPVAKLDRILAPRSAAVIGVSDKGMNNGRIILRNLVENGFDTRRLYVVKAGADQVDGAAASRTSRPCPKR